jgi:hypothetical protein
MAAETHKEALPVRKSVWKEDLLDAEAVGALSL